MIPQVSVYPILFKVFAFLFLCEPLIRPFRPIQPHLLSKESQRLFWDLFQPNTCGVVLWETFSCRLFWNLFERFIYLGGPYGCGWTGLHNFRGTKTKTKSLRSNSPLVNWLRLGRVSVFQDRGAGAAKFWVEEWTNNPRESIYSPSHLWRSRPAVFRWMNLKIQKWKIVLIMRFALQCCWFVFLYVFFGHSMSVDLLKWHL